MPGTLSSDQLVFAMIVDTPMKCDRLNNTSTVQNKNPHDPGGGTVPSHPISYIIGNLWVAPDVVWLRGLNTLIGGFGNLREPLG